MRVASVASVGAMSSPTSALTSVDLPAFSVPASAMRIGWFSRLPMRSSSLCTSARLRYAASARYAATVPPRIARTCSLVLSFSNPFRLPEDQ
jgi:hypothetical protein